MKWFFILSGLIAFAGSPVSSSCPIEMIPPRVVVKFGDPFSVNCISTSTQLESMGWESIYGNGTGLREGVSSVLLEIESVKDWDIEPQCFLNLADGSQCVEALPVTVYKTPDSVLLTNELVPMEAGQMYTLQCDIVNVAPEKNLSVRWFNGDKILHSETFGGSSLSPVNKTSLYDLTAERGYDGTHIWCEAVLDLLPPVPSLPFSRSHSQKVTVLYPPAFTKPENEMVELSGGSKITLDCTATGNPKPVYSWRFPHPIQQTNEDDNQPILSPSIQLPGAYNCTASNSQGTNTKYFTVVEAARNRTTFAALVGVFAALGVLLLIAGLFFVTPDGTFSFNKGSYLKGRPTSSGPV